MRETSRGRPYAVRRHGRKTAATKQKRKLSPSHEARYVRRRRNAGIALIAGLLLTAIAVWYLDGADEILRGVRVGEVEVGGMTQGEAREAVEGHASATFEEIRFGDGVASLSGERLGVKVDAASATEEAYSVGRRGWVASASSTSCARTWEACRWTPMSSTTKKPPGTP